MTVSSATPGRSRPSTSFDALRRYRRATNFLAAAQVYLRDNPLLREPLRAEHIKPRLLGHWGTSPGINLVYAHLDRVIVERGAEVLLITGPDTAPRPTWPTTTSTARWPSSTRA